jgi:hypothetical protein
MKPVSKMWGMVRLNKALFGARKNTPEVVITPEIPAASNHDQDDGKQLDAGWNEGITREITQ